MIDEREGEEIEDQFVILNGNRLLITVGSDLFLFDDGMLSKLEKTLIQSIDNGETHV